MRSEQLLDVLKAHIKFVGGKRGGQRADLRGQDLSGLKLPKLNLQNAILAGINLRECVLPEANFEEADLSRANFHRADLRGASFHGANMVEAVFEEADLRPGALCQRRRKNVPARRRKNVLRAGW